MSKRFERADFFKPRAWLKYARYLFIRERRRLKARVLWFFAYTLRGRAMPRLVFIHLPKTAGTSISIFIMRRIGWQRTGCAVNLAEMPWHEPIGDHHIARANRALYVYGHMPFTVTERLDTTRKNFLITFLREPTARLWSLYGHLHTYVERGRIAPDHPAYPVMKRCAKLPPEDFFRTDDPTIRSLIDNHMVRQIAGQMTDYPVPDSDWPRLLEVAKANLARFDFVGLQESFEADFRALTKALHFPKLPFAPHKNRGSDGLDRQIDGPKREVIAAEIERLTRWDRQLYDAAIELRRRSGRSDPKLSLSSRALIF